VNERKSPERPLRSDEARRTFTDEDGVHWDVREMKTPDYDRRGGKSLLFDSVHAFRLVRQYPDNWMDLTDAELAELSRRA
jgi:hypothetical protein